MRGPRWACAARGRAVSAMDAEALRLFLAGHRYCVLATTTSKTHPVARPVAFTVVGVSFWFATVAGARLRNIRRTPWGSVVVSEGDRDDHRAVAAGGPTMVFERPSENVLAAWEAKHGSQAAWASAWFEITPVRLVSYSAPTTRLAES